MKIAHSHTVYVPIYNGRKLNETYGVSLLGYFACYAALAVIFSLLLSSDMEFGRAFGASIIAMNSNGPFIDLHRATAAELVALSPWVKTVLIFAMISGRVEFVLFFIILLKTSCFVAETLKDYSLRTYCSCDVLSYSIFDPL